MRLFVSIFFGAVIVLLSVQRALRDDNYFLPTMALVLALNLIIIFSVDPSQFDTPEGIAPVLRLLLERPQLTLYFCLMIMALVPPIAWKGSFTFYFSRPNYPKDEWQSHEFFLINKYLSFFWVVVFALCFGSQFVPYLSVQIFAPIMLVLSLGTLGTKRLIAYFIQRLYQDE